MSPIRMLPLLYGAGAGHISVKPSSILEGGAATLEPAVTDGWFVGVITNNSLSSCLDVSSHTFLWPRQSFYCNTFCFLFDIKDLIFFLCVWGGTGYMHVCMGRALVFVHMGCD